MALAGTPPPFERETRPPPFSAEAAAHGARPRIARTYTIHTYIYIYVYIYIYCMYVYTYIHTYRFKAICSFMT